MPFALTDGAKNFAKAALSAGIASGATSLTLASGGGARFPVAPFNASLWNFTDAVDPADDPTVEVVRVTAIVGDTLTITRAQEGTASSNHNTAGKTYKLVAGPTAKLVADINAGCVYLNPSVAPSQTGNINVSGQITGGAFTGDGSSLSGVATIFTAGASQTSTIADDNASNATMYPVWAASNTGNLALKVSSTRLGWNPLTALLQITGPDAGTPRVQIDGIGGANAFSGRRANGTNASKTGVVANDVLAQLTGTGYNSAGAYGAVSADIRICAAETHSASTAASYVIIRTTPPGSLVPVERIRVTETGDVFAQGGIAAVGTLSGTTIYSQLGTGTALSVPGVTIQTGSAATSNTTHAASPYLNWYGSIWSGAAAVAKGMFLGVVGVSGTNNAYVLQLYSSDITDLLQVRGDTALLSFKGTIEIRAGSGGVLRFADGTTQSTAAAGGGGGTVTGTGAATQVAFWSSATAISADTGLTWDSTNDILSIGNPLAAAPTSGAGLEVSGADGVVGRIEVTSYGAANAITGRRVNGTAASKTAVAANDVLAQFTGIGYTSAAAFSSVSADVRLVAAEAYTSAAQGAYIVFRTALIGTTSPVEKMRLTDSGNLGIGTTPAERIHAFGSANVYTLIESSAATGVAVATAYKTGNRRWEIGQAPGIGDNGFTIYDATAPAVRFKIDTAGAVTIGGNVTAPNFLGLASSAAYALQVPQHVQASAYTLAAVDRGCHVAAGAGITVPASVFGAGDIITIYNNTAGAITITQGASVTMYLVGTATTGNRTLAQRGMANVLCVASNTFVISGGGVT
jgi:hypothetical protein